MLPRMEERVQSVSPPRLAALVRDIFARCGMSEAHAALVADVLVWAELRGISYISYADLSQKPEVTELVAAAVKHVNRSLLEGLQVRRFVCLHKEFDADDGEITRTRKIRRNVVEARYQPIIDAIYDNRRTVLMKAQISYETGEVGVIERTLSVQEA